MNCTNNYSNFFKNKKVLITGNTGFKGSWLTLYLHRLGADIYGISNSDHTNDRMFQSCKIESLITQYFLDIVDYQKLSDTVNEIQPDIVFHLAAQSITINAYKNPQDTFQVNAMGMVNILECFRNYQKECDIIVITSDKCYRNNEWVWGYRENDILMGTDPYSASKSIAEIVFQSYYHSFFKENSLVNVVSCRAGNVIGGGDWSPYRIIPNCIEFWLNKETLTIRSPNSIRPWNDVIDIIHGYSLLASVMREEGLNGESFNFGPQLNRDLTVKDIVTGLWSVLGENKNFEPFQIIENKEYSENQFLKLNVDKANQVLKWKTRTEFDEMITRTAEWYQEYSKNINSIGDYTFKLIQDYQHKLFYDATNN